MINIDFRYQSMEINKEKKVVTLININDFAIEIDNDFYQLLSIVINFVNR